MLWSYDKPTVPGWYWVNGGDVVTPFSLKLLKAAFNLEKELVDEDLFPIYRYNTSYKFLEIDINELNTIGNKE